MQFLQKFFTKPKTIQLMITSNNGFHLRPVAKFVSVAKTFSCQVTASHKNRTVDAKGVNSLLSISLEKGDTFTLTCKGKHAQDALDTLTDTFNTLMQNDKEIKVIEKEDTHYEGEYLEGDIISSGIAIAPVNHYKEENIQKKSLLSFKEAFYRSIDELEVLYDKHKENTNAGIYLAQKELLASLETESSTLSDLEILIANASAQLLGSKLESKISDYKDILQRVKNHLGFEIKALFPTQSFILLADDLLPSKI
jgi:phosphotransferase system HPr (HPr) family protein